MKILIMVRHAKSSWKDMGLPDRLRPLNKRGKRDGPVMGERLTERKVEVDQMISSPATRALATAEVIAEAIGYPWEEIVVDKRLYHAESYTILEVVEGLDDHFDCVMCFGHNPGLTEFVNDFSPYTIDNVPTCGIIEFRFNIDTWARVSEVEPIWMDFDYPKKPK